VIARVVAGLLFAAVAAAQSPAGLPDRELVVGVFEAPPFALKNASGEWHGLSVDLWKELAADMGARYRLVEKTQAEILENLSDGRMDTAVGPFAVSMQRERVIDFSHTYLNTGLSLAVRQRNWADRLLDLPRSLASSGAAHVLGVVALLTGLFGAAVWLAERKRNPQFPQRPARGIGSGAWWAGVTASGVGYGDKVPVTLRGRLIAILWMLVSVVLYALVTATLTASLAVAELDRGPTRAALRHTVVGAMGGSNAADYLRRNQIPRSLFPSHRAAIEALLAKKVDAVLVNEEILLYFAARAEGARLEVLPSILVVEDLAFPLADASPLREPLDRALRRSLAGARYRDLKDDYLGGAEPAPRSR